MSSPPLETSPAITPEQWEEALGSLVVGRPAEGPLAEELGGDPGVSLVQDLLGQFRASMVVTNLKLTSRLLMMSLGVPAFEALLAGFWKSHPPQPFAALEADGFARHLQTLALDLPCLEDVLAFEHAALRAMTSGIDQSVPFRHDPLMLLRALGERRLPVGIPQGDFLVEVTAPKGEGAG